MSLVINLYGGPCSGKSTTAAGIFYHLKLQHQHCEMVREYVKNWVWTGLKPTKYDQIYLFGKQVRYESMLYDKVDIIITDSPFMIAGFYDKHYNGSTAITESALDFLNKAKGHGIRYLNFWLPTSKNYDIRGRYNDESDAINISVNLKEYLHLHNVDLIDVPSENQMDFILETIKKNI